MKPADRLRRRQNRPAWRRILDKALLVLGVLVLAGGLEAGLIVHDGLRERLGKCDVGIVLGNRVRDDGTPSRWLAARLNRAVALYKTGAFPLIIVSGGTRAPDYDEPKAMRAYLIAHGVPAEAVIPDPEGFNTWGTAQGSSAIMKARGLKSAMVISQYYHLPRARLAMHKWGVDTVYSAHPDYWSKRDFYSTFREMFGLPEYWLRRRG